MKKRHLHLCILVTLLSSLISGTLWAKNNKARNRNLVTVNATGNITYWDIHPSIRYESVTLTISSGDQTESITSIDSPSIIGLEDGSYNYQLVFAPVLSPSIREELKTARQAANGNEARETVKKLKRQRKIPQHRQAQFGYFTILNGELVSPDAAE